MKFLLAFILVFANFAEASVSVSVNGSNYTIPQTNERGWGAAVTSWIQAISSNTVQPNGGAFTLTNDLDLGSNFGLKTLYYKSRSINIASSGIVRVAVGDSLGWRNNANSGDLLLSVNGSNLLTFNGNLIYSAASIVPTANGGTGQNSTATFPTAGTVITTTPTQYGMIASGVGAASFIIAPVASTTKVLTSGGASGFPTWKDIPASSQEITNVGLFVLPVSNALTIALVQRDGSTNCSTGTASCVIGFRSGVSEGTSFQRTLTTSQSLIIPASTTIGNISGAIEYLYIYAIDNGGTIEVAVSTGAKFDEGTLQNTTLITGGATAGVLYSSPARTGVAIRLIGRIKTFEATAGTWVNGSLETSLAPFATSTISAFYTGTPTGTINTSFNITKYPTKVKDTASAYNTSTGVYSVPTGGTYAIAGGFTITAASYAAGNYAGIQITKNGSGIATQFTRQVTATSSGVQSNSVSIPSYPLLAGDQISIKSANQNTTPAYASVLDASEMYFSITRIGD